jgi:hypothetical protein
MLVPGERPDMLARRLRELLASPMRLAAFGIAAADRAKSRYPWDRIGQETIAVYERAIATAPSRDQDEAGASAARQLAPPRTLRPADGPVPSRPPQRRPPSRKPGRRSPKLSPAGGHAA